MSGRPISDLIQAYRDGEDPGLSALLGELWRLLYGRLPTLTGTRDKTEQHRLLEAYLVELGLPASPDLQYVAGPLLWFAREKGVVPPAKPAGPESDPWTLDPARYAAMGRALPEGLLTYGDWMRDALRGLLFEQQ